MKKYLHILALTIISVALVLTAVACNSANKGSDNTGATSDSAVMAHDSTGTAHDSTGTASDSTGTAPDSSNAGENKNATLAFSDENMNLEQYRQAYISAVLTDGEGEITYSVDDQDVLMLDGASILAVKPGTAIVTAQVVSLGISATCTVTVTEAAIQPEFWQSDALTMYFGTDEKLDNELLLDGELFTLATVTFSTVGNVITVDEDGDLIANGVGTQIVKLTAKIGNYIVAEKEVSVTVAEYAMVETGIDKNEINLTATAEKAGSVNEYELTDLSVTINFVPVENPTFTFSSDNENVAIVEGNKIKAVGAGVAHVTVGYTSVNATYDSIITVNVGREVFEANFSTKYMLLGENGASIDVGAISITVDASTVEKVLVGESEYTFSVEGNTVFVNSDKFGEQVVTLADSKKAVAFNAIIADHTISTASEFQTYFSEGHMNEHQYSVLSNDIDMNNAAWTNWTQNFSTVFDGCGHTVSNFTMTHGFVYKSVSGTIKNVTFNNFGYKRLGVFGGWYHLGLTVENVNVAAYQVAAVEDKALLFTTTETNSISFSNCNISISAFTSEVDTPYSLFYNDGYYTVTMNNVSVSYTGTMIKFDEIGKKRNGEDIIFGTKVEATNVTLKDIRDTGIEYDADLILSSESKVVLDMSKFSKSVSGVTAVNVNGVPANFNEAAGKLTVDCTAAGSVAFNLTTGSKEYTCNILVADHSISNATEFKVYFSEGQMNRYKYTVLANDIDMQNESWNNWSKDFATVFDGRGHKVSNFTMRNGLVTKSVSGTIKNVTFDNFGYGQYGIIGCAQHSVITVENVTINAHQIEAIAQKTLLIYRMNGSITLKDCTINITAYSGETDVYYTLFNNDAYYTVNMTNVTVNYSGTMYKVGETCKKNDGTTDMIFGTNVNMNNVTLADNRGSQQH